MFRVSLEPGLNTKSSRDSAMTKARVRVDCDITLVTLLNADPVYKWFPETKLDKARQYYSIAVDLFKQSRTCSIHICANITQRPFKT